MGILTDYRKSHPQYDKIDDRALGEALHAKYYAQMPKDEFDAKVGLQAPPTLTNNAVLTGLDEGTQMGGDLAKGVSEAIGAGMRGLGIETRDTSKPLPMNVTVPGSMMAATQPQQKNYQPESTEGQYARTVASMAPNVVGGPAGILPKAASVIIPGVASETAGQLFKGRKGEQGARVGGAVVGALASNPLVSAGRYISNALRGVRPQSAVDAIAPTVQGLRDASNADYAYLRTPEGNPIINRSRLGDLRQRVQDILTEMNFHPSEDPQMARLWQRIDTLPNDHSTYMGLEGLRQHAVKVAKNFQTAQGEMGRRVRNTISEFMGDLDEADIIGTQATGPVPHPPAPGAGAMPPPGPPGLPPRAPGPTASGTAGGPIPITDAASGATVINPPGAGAAGAAPAAAPPAGPGIREAVEAANRARRTWMQHKKALTIQGITDAADIRGSANYSQGGHDLALRRGFANLAANPKRMAQFTDEERAAIRLIARGTTTQNVTRFLGKFAMRGPVSAGVTTGIGHMFGPAGPFVLAGLGEAGRSASASATHGNVQALEAMIRGGPRATAALTAARNRQLANSLRHVVPGGLGAVGLYTNRGATEQPE